MKNLCLIIIIISCVKSLKSQNSNLGSWNIINVKYSFNAHWSAFIEGQLRSLKFYDHFHYYEYKGGISYKAANNVNYTLGAGSYQTYREGGTFVTPKNNDEFRLWPQIVLSQSLGKIKIEQRYRAEIRFTSNGYKNRFRYRIAALYAFGQDKNGYRPFQISASNELFFTNNEPYFERNRLQLALTFKISKNNSIQLGYLNQFDYKINDETGKKFLQIGYYIELSRKEYSQIGKEEMKDND